MHASGVDKRYVAAGLAYLRDEDAVLDRRKDRPEGPNGPKADSEQESPKKK